MVERKRPVYLVVRYDEDKEGVPEEERPFLLIAIKQTALAAGIEAAKHENGKVKKGFVSY